MAEDGLRVLADVAFHLLPVVLVGADFLALRADGQKSLELLDICQGLLQFPHVLGEAGLQFHHAHPHSHAGTQFLAKDVAISLASKSSCEDFNCTANNERECCVWDARRNSMVNRS